jgi:hypothetical protein
MFLVSMGTVYGAICQILGWELRAATSLARLWQPQGKRQDAYDLLARCMVGCASWCRVP